MGIEHGTVRKPTIPTENYINVFERHDNFPLSEGGNTKLRETRWKISDGGVIIKKCEPIHTFVTLRGDDRQVPSPFTLEVHTGSSGSSIPFFLLDLSVTDPPLPICAT